MKTIILTSGLAVLMGATSAMALGLVQTGGFSRSVDTPMLQLAEMSSDDQSEMHDGNGSDDGPGHDADDDNGHHGGGSDDGPGHDADDDHGSDDGDDDGDGHDSGDDHGGDDGHDDGGHGGDGHGGDGDGDGDGDD